MRAWRSSLGRFIMSGALLFAMATVLWPTRAYADSGYVDVADLQYWCMTRVDFSSFESSDISISYTSSSANTGVDLGVLRQPTDSIHYELYASGSGLTNSKTCYMLCTVASGSLTQGQRFVLLPSVGGLYMLDYGGISITPTQYKYFGRSNAGTWYQLEAQDGMFTSPANLTYVCCACNARGAANANRDKMFNGHSWNLSVMVPEMQPDVVSSINNQTEELKDTSGSDTVASDVAGQGQQTMENISFMNVLGEVSESWSSATDTTDSDDGLTFPGMSLMGFTVPQYQFQIWELMPTIETPVKTVTTFFCVSMCLRDLWALVSVIFGLQDAELAASMAANGIPQEVDSLSADYVGGDSWAMYDVKPSIKRQNWRYH